MKRQGGIFVEVIVSILLFTVGILALTGTLFYGVKMVAQSREETVKEQEYKNLVENQILGIIREPSPVLLLLYRLFPGLSGTPLPADQIIINSKAVPFKLYRYKQEGKEGTEIYLIKKENTP